MALSRLDGLPATLNFSVWRGNTFERVFALKDNGQPADIAGADFVMTIAWNGGQIRKATADTTMSLEREVAKVTLVLSPAETRQLPTSGRIQYELELRIGDYQNTFLAGVIVAMGGLNSD